MRRSYNRWLGSRCGESGGRLRWVCMPPLQNIESALDGDALGAKEHGACGVLKKGDREGGKYPADPYFEPFYAEAESSICPSAFTQARVFQTSSQPKKMPTGNSCVPRERQSTVCSV